MAVIGGLRIGRAFPLALALLAAGMTLGAAARGEDPQVTVKPRAALRVVVSIPPLKGLIEPLLSGAGIPASVETLIPPGVSEHGYEIPPAQLARLASADLVIEVGLGLEPQVDKVLASHPDPKRRVIVMADAAGVAPAKEESEHEHEHGGEHEHGDDDHHHAGDPHVWLDPVLVQKMIVAEAVALRELMGADTEASGRVTVSEAAMLGRVQDVDSRYRRTIGPATRKTIVVGHDAWGYLARRYGLETVAIKGLTASEPTPGAIQAAVKAVRNLKATCVFAEPQLSRAASEHIAAATGVPVRKLDPLGDGDWFGLMDANLKELAGALGVAVAPAQAEAAVPFPAKPDHP